jgi:hypothetical protein
MIPFSDKFSKIDAHTSIRQRVRRKQKFATVEDSVEWFKDERNRGTGVIYSDFDYKQVNEPNELIIGYKDRELESEPVSINVRTRTNWLIVSNLAGSGKSVLGFNIIEQYRYKLRPHIVVFDSKPEFQYRSTANSDPGMKAKLNMLKRKIPIIRPRAAPLSAIAPKFTFNSTSDEQMFSGESIRYDLSEMEWSDIITLFGLDGDNKSVARSLNKLQMAVHGYNDEEDFNEALQSGGLSEAEIVSTSELLDSFKEGSIKDDALKANLMSMISARVIGRSSEFDIVDYLNNNQQMVQYVTQTATDDSHLNRVRAYIAVELKRINRARKAYTTPMFSGHGKTLDRPVVYYFTEFQTVFPKPPWMPSTKREILTIYDALRYQNTSIVADCADITAIDKRGIKQSDIILAFKLTGASLERLRREKNLTWDQEQQIANLYFDKRHPPQECAIIPVNHQGEALFETFYPLPPMGGIQQEQQLRV